jgi:tetratricopeptide (TPR) repeat protein
MWDQNVHVFIERYARRKKKVPHSGDGHLEAEQNVKPGQDSSEGASADGEGGGHQDLALDQGGLLLQLAMRAYAGRNNESAIHLLKLCEEDLRSALAEEGMSSKVLCQLGAIAGARGDVSRSSQDLPSAAAAYRESATWFEIVEEKDAEVVHDLSVAYNKLGDLHYLAKRPDEAREEYLRSLELRQNAHKADSTASQVLDLVVSFTKVADLDRASNKERAAAAHFREAAKLAAELGQKRETYSGALEQKRLSLLDFIVAQMKELGEEV